MQISAGYRSNPHEMSRLYSAQGGPRKADHSAFLP